MSTGQGRWVLLSILDPNLVPGYKSHVGPPDDYAAPGQTFWTKNKQTNARFGVARMANGRFRLRSSHRVRALDLVGSQTVFPGQSYDSGVTQRFHLFYADQQEHTLLNVPAARDNVVIDFEAVSFLIDVYRYI